MTRPRAVVYCVGAVMLLTSFFGCSPSSTPGTTRHSETAEQEARELLAESEPFPFDFTITDINGVEHTLADYRGKVVVVDFWGTWCPPCRAEIPSFIRLQKTYGEQGFQMFGLNYEHAEGVEALNLVKEFVDSHGINYPCALGDEDLQAKARGIRGYPTTLFIDKSGTVRLKLVGLHSYETLEAVVLTLLDEEG